MVNIPKLKGKMVEMGFTTEQLSAVLNMDRATLYRRFKNSEDFTVGEAKAIAEALNLSSEEVNAIFFSSVVA